LPGDRIVSIDQVPVDDWFSITEIIRQSPSQRLVLGVERDGRVEELPITPLLSERYAFDDRGQVLITNDGDPVIEYVGFVGIGSAVSNESRPASAVLPAVWTTWWG
jgi:membrane-associated protease RseP (regulator of RpoE activity)